MNEINANKDYYFVEDGFIETNEVEGKNMKVYIYKVPKLEYDNEDIAIDF